MNTFINKISLIPGWYGTAIVLVYSILLAEYFSVINDLCTKDLLEVSSLTEIIMQISYGISIFSSIAAWTILCLMFHLVALLFDGQQEFKKFLFTSSYLYIIPSIALIIAINLLGTIELENSKDMVSELMDNTKFNTVSDIVGYSFIPFYLLSSCIIRYQYKIKWLYSFLSVAIPVLTIWGLTELYKII